MLPRCDPCRSSPSFRRPPLDHLSLVLIPLLTLMTTLTLMLTMLLMFAPVYRCIISSYLPAECFVVVVKTARDMDIPKRTLETAVLAYLKVRG